MKHKLLFHIQEKSPVIDWYIDKNWAKNLTSGEVGGGCLDVVVIGIFNS